MHGAGPAWDFAAASPGLVPGVLSMVGYRGLEVPEVVHRGLPSASLTFIVSLDEGVEASASAELLDRARPLPVVLGGLHVRTSHVRQRRRQAGVQLAVHPLAARRLFGVPSAELSVTDFDGAPVLGRSASRLHERLADGGGWSRAFEQVAADLLARWNRHEEVRPRPEVAEAWRILEVSRGGASVREVAEAVGLSPRRLSTLFDREVGRSPKTVAMLMRFDAAVGRLARSVRAGQRVDLARVAAETGYSDQAHLSREFVRFAGVSPTGWLAEEFRNLQDGGHAWRAE